MSGIVAAAWLAWIGVTLFFIGWTFLKEPDISLVQGFIHKDGEKSWKRIAEAVGPTVAVWFPVANINGIEEKLTWSGNPLRLSAEEFIGLKIMALGGGVAASIFLATFGVPAVFIPIVAGILYVIPDGILSGAVEKRQNTINRDMPDMVGLLATAVVAGMELGPALERVSNAMPGPLGEELRRTWREMATGMPRATAFRGLAKRTGVKIVRRFVEMLIAAEESGGLEISRTLQAFKSQVRASQQRRAQEAAKKVPTKMLAPIVICIFLPMLAMLLTPVAFTLMGAF